MPPKNSEMHKRKSSSSHNKESSKRTRTNKQGNFRVADLRNELPYSTEECLKWFNSYASAESSSSQSDRNRCVGPEGIERLCQDIQVDPEDKAMLALAWKLKAEQMGYLKCSEWLRGMAELECDNCEKLKRQMPVLRQLMDSDSHFKSIYQFSFDFSRTPGHRNVEIDMSKAMLRLLLESKWSLLPDFILFLDGSRYKVLNRDQWNNILEFSRTIRSDLSNYDVNGAWPVILDEFVEAQQKAHPPMDAQADEL